MNVVFLTGNLTRDIELKYTPKGTPIADISIASNRVSYTDEGEKREEVLFQECRVWGRAAESVAKHFHKGKPILIHGRLAQEQWTDKVTGKPRSKTLVIVEHWEFHGGERREPQETGQAPPATASSPTKSYARPSTYKQPKDEAEPAGAAIETDEIPF